MPVTVKEGVQFTVLAPAGMRLLEAIKETARTLNSHLMITCACDDHDPDDPHTTGEAYDLRSHDLQPRQKRAVLRELMLQLQHGELDAPLAVSGGLATMSFFAFLEDENTENEHFHVQRRRSTVYTIEDYLAD